MKKEISSHFESKPLINTTKPTTTTSNDPTIVTNMNILPFPPPIGAPLDPQAVNNHVTGIITHVTRLSTEVQQINNIPAVGNQQVLDAIARLSGDIGGMRADIQGLIDDVRDLQTEVRGLKTVVQGLADGVGILNRGFHQSGQRTGNVDGKMDELNAHMETVSGKVDDCNGGLTRVEGRMQSGEDQMTRMECSIADGLSRVEGSVTEVSTKLQASTFNKIARAQNAYAHLDQTSLLATFHNVQTNQPIAYFPDTKLAIAAMTTDSLQALLQELGCPSADADPQAMRHRLRLIIGLA